MDGIRFGSTTASSGCAPNSTTTCASIPTIRRQRAATGGP